MWIYDYSITLSSSIWYIDISLQHYESELLTGCLNHYLIVVFDKILLIVKILLPKTKTAVIVLVITAKKMNLS